MLVQLLAYDVCQLGHLAPIFDFSDNDGVNDEFFYLVGYEFIFSFQACLIFFKEVFILFFFKMCCLLCFGFSFIVGRTKVCVPKPVL